jgi:hypothetical protein
MMSLARKDSDCPFPPPLSPRTVGDNYESAKDSPYQPLNGPLSGSGKGVRDNDGGDPGKKGDNSNTRK